MKKYPGHGQLFYLIKIFSHGGKDWQKRGGNFGSRDRSRASLSYVYMYIYMYIYIYIYIHDNEGLAISPLSLTNDRLL